MSDKLQYALDRLADQFRSFSRNGRWGTCVACPKDREGHTYPEFCQFTKRCDHQLSMSDLASTWENYTTRD